MILRQRISLKKISNWKYQSWNIQALNPTKNNFSKDGQKKAFAKLNIWKTNDINSHKENKRNTSLFSLKWFIFLHSKQQCAACNEVCFDKNSTKRRWQDNAVWKKIDPSQNVWFLMVCFCGSLRWIKQID